MLAGARIIGVNNRDLHTLEVRVETSFELIAAIPDDCIAVSESGLRSAEDLARLRAAGFDAFLIGEHLMREADPGAALRRLMLGERLTHPSARESVRERRSSRKNLRRHQLGRRPSWPWIWARDALGFNFYPPSPRSVSPAAAWEIIRRLPPLVAAVGVFVNWPADVVAALARALRLDGRAASRRRTARASAAHWRAASA